MHKVSLLLVLLALVPLSLAAPNVKFEQPTPPNLTVYCTASHPHALVNISVEDPNLDTFILVWGDKNYTYNACAGPTSFPLSGSDVALGMTFNNNSCAGEHYSSSSDNEVVIDFSGNNNNGLTRNGIQYLPNGGKYGGAFKFDGSDDFIQVPYSPSLGLHEYTVEAWIMALSSKYANGILGTRFGGDMTFDVKFQNTQGWHGDIGTGSHWLSTGANYFPGISLNRWYHLVYVVKANLADIYVNGNYGRTIRYNGVPLFMKPSQTLRIGDSFSTEYGNIEIDDLRIYSRALSEDEVKTHYNTKFYKVGGRWIFTTDNYALFPNNPVNYYGWANNSGGETNRTEIRTVVWDTTSPTLSYVNPTLPHNSITGNDWIVVNVSIYDGSLKNFTYYLYDSSNTLIRNNTYQSNDYPHMVNWTGLSGGEYYYNVTACDHCGRCTQSSTRHITLDPHPPNASIVAPPNGSVLTDKHPTLTLNLTDDVDTNIDYTIYVFDTNGNLLTTEVGNAPNGTLKNHTLSYSFDLNGTPTIYSFIVEARDDAGGRANSTQLYVYLVEPNLTLVSPPNNSKVGNSSINFTFRVVDAHYDTLNCSLYIDGVMNQTNASVQNNTLTAFAVDNMTEGNHNWTISCRNGGDTELNKTYYFVVDKTPPSISNVSVKNITSSSAAIVWTTNELTNGSVAYGLSNTALHFNAINSAYAIHHVVVLSGLSSSTEYYFNITSCDEVGNCNTSGVYNFTTSSSASGNTHEKRRLYATWDTICPGNVLKVHVEDNKGRDIENARVVLKFDTMVEDTELTDENGYAYLTFSYGGRYMVEVFKRGYRNFEGHSMLITCLTKNHTNESLNTTILQNTTQNNITNESNTTVANETPAEESYNGNPREEAESQHEKSSKINQPKPSPQNPTQYGGEKKRGVGEREKEGERSVVYSTSCCLAGLCLPPSISSFLNICWYWWLLFGLGAAYYLIVIIKKHSRKRKRQRSKE